MNLGPTEIALIILAVLLLFGYKKLPDASRAMGRSLRIFKGEMKGLKADGPVSAPGPDAARLEQEALAAEARAAELRAAELRARAERAA